MENIEKTKIERDGNRGFCKVGSRVVSFEVSGASDTVAIQDQQYKSLYNQYINDNSTIPLGNFTVALWGDRHNLYPQMVYDLISDNKLLPEILSKQVEFLFGRGPYLYTEEVVGEGKDAKKVRTPVVDKDIDAWLESWEEKGYDDYKDYLRNQIADYYHVKACVSKYIFNKSRRIPGFTDILPIAALQYVGSEKARFATKTHEYTKALKDSEMTHIAVGDWLSPSKSDFDIFPRFNPAKPFKDAVAISFVKEKTFTKDIYPYNDWFKGLFEWIKGANLTPRYINSFLKNALNAFVHVEIPQAWIEKEAEKIKTICANNLTGYGDIVSEYEGVKLLDSNGDHIDFVETMIDARIAHELRKITTLLSGEGKNQGKLWASTTYGDMGWKFNDFPGKFKEYMNSVIDFDKRADQVVIAGLGISSSISNVENDGVLSKSGSDVYYNFLVYQLALTLPEYHVCKDINRAIKLNFPDKKHIKLGLQMDIPARQSETTPSQRLPNTAER